MSVVIAFLGDSLPGNAHSPCRSCQLYVAKKVNKTMVEYMKDFMGITFHLHVIGKKPYQGLMRCGK
ncbi:hypothetical protein MJO28_003492 [Puccinia striiformis f. sp. tritici]|uniref:Uncharacterized protein n=1 Tax=Puccinia striiformis f. sp. tritici TaxID=168172 RepID=A0ACC0EUX9_9BASI|nr:hypothetical protein MJO28_003492 [Puccinia striiformis f. sp. tritici]KAI7965447.1 hypothetical protein MJO29_003545 [Puccinia striiformis f. sp. tritici]